MLSLSYLLMSIFIIILTSLSLHSIISMYFDQNSKLEQNPQLQAREENTKINSDSLANINNVSDNSINNSISNSWETLQLIRDYQDIMLRMRIDVDTYPVATCKHKINVLKKVYVANEF